MDQSTPQHVDQVKTSWKGQQETILGNHEKAFNLIRKAERADLPCCFNILRDHAVHANLSSPFLSGPIKSGQLIPVDRSGYNQPENSHADALTHDSLQRLQIFLANPTPLARWKSETTKTGVWNNLGEVAAGHVAQNFVSERIDLN